MDRQTDKLTGKTNAAAYKDGSIIKLVNSYSSFLY